jgi:hypothetical protein
MQQLAQDLLEGFYEDMSILTSLLRDTEKHGQAYHLLFWLSAETAVAKRILRVQLRPADNSIILPTRDQVDFVLCCS